MKKIIIFLGVLSMYCNPPDFKDEKQYYKVTFLDTLTFSEHNIIRLRSFEDKEFILISKKFKLGSELPKDSSYQVIGLNNVYKLEIEEIKNLPRLHIRGEDVPQIYYIGDILFYKNGEIKMKVFQSPSILYNYVKFEY